MSMYQQKSSSSYQSSSQSFSSQSGGMSGGMSGGGSEGGRRGSSGSVGSFGGLGGRSSGISTRTFVFTRSDPSAARGRSKSMGRASMGGGAGMGGGASLSAGTATALAESGVTSFSGKRETEKRELQGLNERLASFIERMHYKDAEIANLKAEIEALRNRKGQDLQPIRDMYEGELDQARKVIDEMSSKQGVAEAKVVGLQDEIAHLKDIMLTMDGQIKEYRNKLAISQHTVGELEAELASLKARSSTKEVEGEKGKEMVTKYQDQIRTMRADLEAAVAAHIEAECIAQTKTEEAAFYKDLLDNLKTMEPEPITIKGMDAAQFWQASMKTALREIQAAADEKIDMIQQESEAKVAAQMATVSTSSVKEDMQVNQLQEEIAKLKSAAVATGSSSGQSSQQIALLQSQVAALTQQLEQKTSDYEALTASSSSKLMGLQGELDSVLAQLQVLTDAKMSLELEIACYQKLLEGEESRAMSVGGGAGGMGGGAGMSAGMSMSAGGSMSSQMGKMTVQRQSRGPIGFQSLDPAGANIVIECDATQPSTKGQNLQGWKVVKQENGRTTASVMLGNFMLTPGNSYTVWAKGSKSRASADNEMISSEMNFGSGSCQWQLFDQSGQEKANLTATVQM